jgi:hypothetical protein
MIMKPLSFFTRFAGTAAIACFSLVLSANPIASYPFNGDANDTSGNGHNGTLPGSGVTATTDRFGNPNSAYQFDGTGYIETTAKQENVTQYSVSAWVKMNAGEYGSIITNRNDGSAVCAGLIFDITNVGCVRMGANGAGYLRSAHANYRPIWDGRWHHVVGVFNCPANTAVTDAHFSIYIDGVKLTGLEPWNTGTAKVAPISGNGYTRIGEWDNAIGTSSSKTKGIIDDVSIYERALTQEDITELYAEGGWDLMAHFPLNGSIEDISARKWASTSAGVTTGLDRFGKQSAAQFDGASQSYIELTNSASVFNTLPVSTSFWFNATKQGGLVNKYVAGSANGFNVVLEEGKLRAWYYSDGNTTNFLPSPNLQTDISLNMWHHCAVNFSPSGGELFLNGQLAATL